jgi:hypothetical protein
LAAISLGLNIPKEDVPKLTDLLRHHRRMYERMLDQLVEGSEPATGFDAAWQ